jgi:hypothetical protein
LAVIVGIAALVVACAAAAVVATGTVGGKHKSKTLADAAFWRAANSAVNPLGQADATAAENASTAAGALTRAADGGLIVRAADEASAHLRGLHGLSGKQKGEVQLLLAFVASNRRYGQAFSAFTPEDPQGEIALDRAAAEARAAVTTAESGLPGDLQLPSQTTFISLRSPSETLPSPTTNATPPAPDAAAYVRQVDALLQQSHAVVLALRSFVPRAASDAINRTAAVTLARSYADQRRLELEQAQALTAPPAFALTQQLLIRSLQASLADDQALVAWALARRDASGNAQAAFDRATRIGAQATALKQQFLRAYGPRRQAATGLSAGTLPNNF